MMNHAVTGIVNWERRSIDSRGNEEVMMAKKRIGALVKKAMS